MQDYMNSFNKEIADGAFVRLRNRLVEYGFTDNKLFANESDNSKILYSSLDVKYFIEKLNVTNYYPNVYRALLTMKLLSNTINVVRLFPQFFTRVGKLQYLDEDERPTEFEYEFTHLKDTIIRWVDNDEIIKRCSWIIQRNGDVYNEDAYTNYVYVFQ